jgi:hypothetical protein
LHKVDFHYKDQDAQTAKYIKKRKYNNYASPSNVFALRLYAILPRQISLLRSSARKKSLSRASNLPKIIRASSP